MYNMDIIKPKYDNRIFKFFTLENNIKCILINDNTLDKSYVVTSVNVGSLSNKNYYDGMAHLLEHMCFITSKNYKEKDFLVHKVTEAGGHTNAFTAEENTVYHLDVFTKNLEYILNIFIDFLTNAELKKEYILTELKNVDAEHKKNIHNELWKLHYFKKVLANHGFSTGSSETLNKKDIYEKMIHFYKKYYHANNISVCIASNNSIEETLKIVKKTFGSIPKSNKTNKSILIKPFYDLNEGKTYQIVSSTEDKILEYIFETPSGINSNFYDLLVNIIISPYFKDHLFSIAYITSFHAEYDLTGIFIIKIKLTSKGLSNINYVNSYIEYALNKVLQLDLIKIFNYFKKIFKFHFENLSKLDTLDLSINLINNLLYYSPKNIYYANYHYESLNIDDIKKYKKYINFKKCIKIILCDKLLGDNYLIDPHYHFKYTEIKNLEGNVNLTLPIAYDIENHYMNVKPKIINNLKNKNPVLIKKNIWFGHTSQFNEPYVYCSILFSSKKYFSNINNYLLTYISVYLLNYFLPKEFYKSFQLNYDTSIEIYPQKNLLELQFKMYNDTEHIQLFINDVLDKLTNKINFDDKFIKAKVDALTDNIKKTKNINPFEYCNYIFSNLYKHNYNYKELLIQIKKINIEDIKLFINKLFYNVSATVFIFGNIIEIPNFDKLNSHFKIKPYKFDQVIIQPKLRFKHPNKKEKSNCVKISYIVGKFDPLLILHLHFVKLITSTMFFEELRTTKQLGYLVEMYSSKIGEYYYIYQQIQSEEKCSEIINHINQFNDKLIDKIKEIDLNKWKETITSNLEMESSNLSELNYKYFNEIIERTFLFNRNKLLLKEINNITIKSLIHFIQKYILDNNNKNIVEIFT
jgi:insulysin